MDELTYIFPNDAHPWWSIMIVLYPYITGLVAGAFVVSALYHVWEVKSLKPVARLALVTALCFCSCATMPLLLHLHHPERAFNIMITPNTNSAMAGFGAIYNVYLLLLIVEVWLEFRPDIIGLAGKPGRLQWLYKILALGDSEVTEQSRVYDEKVIGWLALIGIPAACILHGYVGFLFGAVKANPWWSTALMPVVFLVSAVVSGIAALILLYVFICWRRGVSCDADCIKSMARYLWISLTIAVTLELLEVIHMAYEGGAEWHIIQVLLTEKLRFSYIQLQLLIGSLVPFLLLLLAMWPRLYDGFRTFLSSVAAMLVLVQVFAMRWNVVIGGQLFSRSFRGFTEYHLSPYGPEGLIAAVCVMIAPFVVLYIACQLLPVWPQSTDATPNADDAATATGSEAAVAAS
ncbi:MAG: NrfD/PsrC family molybdoenzyme membrane anchor subunit [Planctomycetaceae bacterium]